MITDFSVFCMCVYLIVDDLIKAFAAPARMMGCGLAHYAGECASANTDRRSVADEGAYKAGIVKGKQLLAISIVYRPGSELEAKLQFSSMQNSLIAGASVQLRHCTWQQIGLDGDASVLEECSRKYK